MTSRPPPSLPTIYPTSQSAELDMAVFKNPASEYRSAPFWCWNCKLDPAQLIRQMDVLAKMGFGGFHIHTRTGLATPYMGPEFMEIVHLCVDRAREKGMRAWLYDEDRWPCLLYTSRCV